MKNKKEIQFVLLPLLDQIKIVEERKKQQELDNLKEEKLEKSWNHNYRFSASSPSYIPKTDYIFYNQHLIQRIGGYLSIK